MYAAAGAKLTDRSRSSDIPASNKGHHTETAPSGEGPS